MSRLALIPYPIAHFLGYRKPAKKPAMLLPMWRVYLWSFIGSWLGIAILEIIFSYGTAFSMRNTPMIVGSFGASAVLLFGPIDVPLAQPRNAFFGHIIGALCGIIINLLFNQVPQHWASSDQQYIVRWVAGSTAMAISIVLMQITKTVHPPGGATALIAVTEESAVQLGWFYLAVIVLSITLQIALACLVNNIERRYPIYWWSPETLPIKADPQTFSTVMSAPDRYKDEDVQIDMPDASGAFPAINISRSTVVELGQ